MGTYGMYPLRATEGGVVERQQIDRGAVGEFNCILATPRTKQAQGLIAYRRFYEH